MVPHIKIQYSTLNYVKWHKLLKYWNVLFRGIHTVLLFCCFGFVSTCSLVCRCAGVHVWACECRCACLCSSACASRCVFVYICRYVCAGVQVCAGIHVCRYVFTHQSCSLGFIHSLCVLDSFFHWPDGQLC